MSIVGMQIEKITNVLERSNLNKKICEFDDKFEQLNRKIEFLDAKSNATPIEQNVNHYVDVNQMNEVIKDIEANLTELAFNVSSTPRDITSIKEELEKLRNEMKELKTVVPIQAPTQSDLTIGDPVVRDVTEKKMNTIPKISIVRKV